MWAEAFVMHAACDTLTVKWADKNKVSKNSEKSQRDKSAIFASVNTEVL